MIEASSEINFVTVQNAEQSLKAFIRVTISVLGNFNNNGFVNLNYTKQKK